MPLGCGVVPNSTPVIAFGEVRKSEIATLGINPSRREFLDINGELLRGPAQRLADLPTLGADDCAALSDTQVKTVLNYCSNYFRGSSYQWFDSLERFILAPLGVSYFDGSACHLDLIQWATDPVWGKISSEDVKRQLMDEGITHFQEQLKTENLKSVIVLGRVVWNQLLRYDICSIEYEREIFLGKKRSIRCTLRCGQGTGRKFVGWTSNLQTQRGITNDDRRILGEWLVQVLT
jgi:hypothetical protein